MFLSSLLFSTNNYCEVLKTSNKTISRRVYTDKDGDKVMILDTEARLKLGTLKEVHPNQVFDNEDDINKFKSQIVKDALTTKKIKFNSYIASEGDTLPSISKKIYGNENRAKELAIINEDLLKGVEVKPGMQLKYIVEDKELNHDQ
jgi:hypothetical protein